MKIFNLSIAHQLLHHIYVNEYDICTNQVSDITKSFIIRRLNYELDNYMLLRRRNGNYYKC